MLHQTTPVNLFQLWSAQGFKMLALQRRMLSAYKPWVR